jgi:hypothetical protein
MEVCVYVCVCVCVCVVCVCVCVCVCCVCVCVCVCVGRAFPTGLQLTVNFRISNSGQLYLTPLSGWGSEESPGQLSPPRIKATRGTCPQNLPPQYLSILHFVEDPGIRFSSRTGRKS